METNIHKGHRERMRRKFSRDGARVFETYELLEMLLYHVIPYKDTNPISKNLISAFGGIDGVFRASREELMKVEGVGAGVADFILSVGELIDFDSGNDSVAPECYDDYNKTGRMVNDFFKKKNPEGNLVVIFLFDNSMRFISARVLYEYDYSSGAVKADAFLEAAVSSRAAVAITAHIHKHGPLFPTTGDMETNKLVTSALAEIGVWHIEHYVICGDDYVGIMGHLNSAFAQTPELRRFFKSKEVALYE